MLDSDTLQELPGRPVAAVDGEEIGTVADAFVNSADDRPAWVAVTAGERQVLAPLDEATFEDGLVTLRYEADVVHGAPDVEVEDEGALLPEIEEALYEHYGITDVVMRDHHGSAIDLDSPDDVDEDEDEDEEHGTSRDPRGADGGADDSEQAHP